MNDENKDLNVEDTKVEETTQEEVEAKIEAPVDSEEYYDDIDYQKKNQTEEVKAKTRSVLREVLDWILCFVIAFVAYLLINYFLFSAPTVKQASMYPTIISGEKVFSIRPWMKGYNFNYGDIVTFEAPIDNKLYLNLPDEIYVAQYETYTGITKFLYDFMDVNKTSYIKRVIGKAGDHIEIKAGVVYRNGEKLDEPYLREAKTEATEEKYADVIVPEGTLYLMGDNREASKDSRAFGCIPVKRVNGYVVNRIWPLNRLGAIDKNK